jgi:uncharacterized iron-regulated membrane protein
LFYVSCAHDFRPAWQANPGGVGAHFHLDASLSAMNDTPNSSAGANWPDYRTVWRWHFYAGLFCIPFVLILAISGGIYLFKPQIEAWNDRPYDHLDISGSPATAAEQIRAALAAVPNSGLQAYELPKSNDSATRVIVRQDGEAIRVYVHPQSLAILHTFPEDQRFMRWLFRLHGELLMGNRGSNLVELAASWTIVMILTGLYLWWPRNSRGLGGVLYPRMNGGSRMFWRDWHSVAGIWISGFALLLLASGLPWAKFWGDYFKTIRRWTGTAVVQQDWSNGSPGPARRASAGEHEGHHGGKRRRGSATVPKDLAAVDRIVAAVAPLELAPPVLISPPDAGGEDWSVKSMTANRPWRVNLTVNGQSGEITSRQSFGDRHLVDRIVAVGIAAHEGQLFGWPNQLLGLFTAAGLVLLSVSGVILWWRRRDTGVLGAPKQASNPKWSWSLTAAIALLALYLPLFGVSLILVLAIERLVLSRIPVVRDWLGLTTVPATLSTKPGLASLLLLSCFLGCGPRPVTGGTPGVLIANGQPLAEVQINVHQMVDNKPQKVGFGISDSDGSFSLVKNEAKGLLRLAPGEYRCTLESAGAPIQVPPEYAAWETTPLNITWREEMRMLELVLPLRLP